MSDLVADSSVVAKWVMPEADSPPARLLMATVAQRGDRFVVLDLVYPEVANAIWKQFRRTQASIEDAKLYIAELLTLDLEIKAARELLPDAWEIAAQYGVAVYDAMFVALTVQMKIPGITADGPLCKALGSDFPQIKMLQDWH
jgi:predicted nucleic acid-binding protein